MRFVEHFRICATRGKARAFYPTLLRELEASKPFGEIPVSFEGVQHVSASFLDETIVRLAEERPDLAKRVALHGLSLRAADALRWTLKTRGLDWTVRTDANGAYLEA